MMGQLRGHALTNTRHVARVHSQLLGNLGHLLNGRAGKLDKGEVDGWHEQKNLLGLLLHVH